MSSGGKKQARMENEKSFGRSKVERSKYQWDSIFLPESRRGGFLIPFSRVEEKFPSFPFFSPNWLVKGLFVPFEPQGKGVPQTSVRE
jgi:hypothetical protein